MKATHKYGIYIPTSVDHAEEIDKRNQNTFWQDAINLEMSNIGIAFKVLDQGETPPPGHNNSKWTYDIYSQYGLHQKIFLGQGRTSNSIS